MAGSEAVVLLPAWDGRMTGFGSGSARACAASTIEMRLEGARRRRVRVRFHECLFLHVPVTWARGVGVLLRKGVRDLWVVRSGL